MRSQFRHFLLLATCTLCLAACKFQATTRMEPDGSGELRTEVGYSAEERQNMDNQPVGTDPENICGVPANQGQTPSNVTVTEEQRGNETWCVTTTAFDNLDDLRAQYQTKDGMAINRLEMEGGVLYYDVDIDTTSKESSFSNFETITWTLVLPGAPMDHNATQARSNTLTWALSPQSGVVNLRAESTIVRAGPQLADVLGLAIGLCAGILIGGAMMFTTLRLARK